MTAAGGRFALDEAEPIQVGAGVGDVLRGLDAQDLVELEQASVSARGTLRLEKHDLKEGAQAQDVPGAVTDGAPPGADHAQVHGHHAGAGLTS